MGVNPHSNPADPDRANPDRTTAPSADSVMAARIQEIARAGARAGGGYSFFVRLMKIVLPALAFGIIALLAAWPRIQGLDQSPLKRDSGELEMMRALYTGTDQENRPFSITADRAVQSTSEPGVLDLVRPVAEMTLKDGTWIALKADRGRYNDQTGKLLLLGNANLFHDAGYEFKTDEAHLDIKAGNAWGDLPVTGQGPFGELFSKGFRLFDNGTTIVFTGPAHLDLVGGGDDGVKPGADPAEEPPPDPNQLEIPQTVPTVAQRPVLDPSTPEQIQR